MFKFLYLLVLVIMLTPLAASLYCESKITAVKRTPIYKPGSGVAHKEITTTYYSDKRITVTERELTHVED